MRPGPGWHDDARRLAAAGLTTPKIAADLGVSVTSVLKAIDPRYAARQRALTNEAARRRYHADPQLRAARKAAVAERRARAKPQEDTDDVFA